MASIGFFLLVLSAALCIVGFIGIMNTTAGFLDFVGFEAETRLEKRFRLFGALVFIGTCVLIVAILLIALSA